MILAAIPFLMCPAVAASVPQPSDYVRTVVELSDDETRLALSDLNGDGRLDLVLVEPQGIAVRYLRADGSYPDAHDARLAWPSTNVGWVLADADGDGATEILCLVDGSEVRSWRAPEAGGEFGEGEHELDVEGRVPRGVFRLRFLRDIDGDGRLDLIVPALGAYAIHRRLAGGGWDVALEVALETRINYSFGDPGELDSSFGQDLRIPWFKLDDVTGDGRLDLVAETEEAVYFYLAAPALPAEATWTLDKKALRDQLGEAQEIDLDNLLAESGRQVSWRVSDVTGEGANDLVVQVGQKISVYHDGSLTGPVGPPDQLLKSSGLVFCFYLRDTNGDELLDLQICRGEEISLARVVRWLVLPGAFDLDVYTYDNTGGKFTTKPTRRNTLSIEFPRILSFIKQMEEMEEELEALEDIPTRRADLAGDGVADDVLDISERELVVFLGRAPADESPFAEFDGEDLDQFFEVFLLGELDGVEDGGTKTFDLGKIDEWAHIQGVGLREACAQLEPDRRAALVPGLENATIYVRDLDRDGRPDVVVAGKKEQIHVLQFLVDRAQ